MDGSLLLPFQWSVAAASSSSPRFPSSIIWFALQTATESRQSLSHHHPVSMAGILVSGLDMVVVVVVVMVVAVWACSSNHHGHKNSYFFFPLSII
jgi:hypothetical protein